jgi:uncharacterized protein
MRPDMIAARAASVSQRIIVFSDTHGNRMEMRHALGRYDGIDAVVHLGDGLAEGEEVSREFGIPFLGVLGNEDGAAAFPRERIIPAGPWRLLAIHGDRFDISPYDGEEKWNEQRERMAELAALRGAGALLFGHSHRAVLEECRGVVLCNPGDQYVGSRGGATFCLLDFNRAEMSAALYVKEGDGWVSSPGLVARA